MEINGSVAVVTGAVAGLGAATVEALASRGASVVAVDLADADVPGSAAAYVQADITRLDEIDAAMRTAVQRFGRVDSVVHCAGIAAGFRLFGEAGRVDPARFQRIVDVNLVGTFNVALASATVMRENPELPDRGRGVLVNTASIAAYEGQRGQVGYAASKAGVVGMTLPLARDLAEFGIRCVTLAPGAFATALTTDLAPWLQEKLVSYTAYPNRLGRPEEFAALACAVIENELLNAEIIRIDAGSRLPAL
jgi:NAD(P)-dependent dehydrogenase (short-subunit alcohol dehydrogenase family)